MLPTDKLTLPVDFAPDPRLVAALTAGVWEDGVREPLICYNRKDDGTYEVRIGCKRILVARDDIWKLRRLVKCIDGQRDIPDGVVLHSREDVVAAFHRPDEQRFDL